MVHRVYCEDLSGSHAEIEEAEAHHLLHVLRIKSGEQIQLFDGAGNSATAQITELTRRSLTAEIVARQSEVPRQQARIIVAVAPPKGDRLRWMIEKLTEIGVDQIVLLQTARTIVTPGETKVDKLRANIIAACKQSGRNRLMDVQPLIRLNDFLRSDVAQPQSARLYLAHPLDPFSTQSATDPNSTAPSTNDSILFVGPEGGFTDNEVELLRERSAQTLSWPATILRIETAAIVFASLLISKRSL
ncbi:MAG: 16S rRNA (uracil(1498)-N(3))-methyltransferase [Planctomyces sp.]|nr:16S rRNA (uracil(1498)-N(3))-methyltransferase [Planctomyces sp.]